VKCFAKVVAILGIKKYFSAIIDVLGFDILDKLNSLPSSYSIAGHPTPFNDDLHVREVLVNLSELV
jgi:hypothetical protein